MCTCEETCGSVWPPNASLYPSLTCVHLRLLAGPFDQGLRPRRVFLLLGTLRYGDADALKYATIKESLGRERNVCGGKTKLRFVASDAISLSSLLIWLLSAGETRELLFLSNGMVFIADAEFLLLYEESRSDNLDFPNKNFRCFLCRTKMELSVQPI